MDAVSVWRLFARLSCVCVLFAHPTRRRTERANASAPAPVACAVVLGVCAVPRSVPARGAIVLMEGSGVPPENRGEIRGCDCQK